MEMLAIRGVVPLGGLGIFCSVSVLDSSCRTYRLFPDNQIHKYKRGKDEASELTACCNVPRTATEGLLNKALDFEVTSWTILDKAPNLVGSLIYYVHVRDVSRGRAVIAHAPGQG